MTTPDTNAPERIHLTADELAGITEDNMHLVATEGEGAECNTVEYIREDIFRKEQRQRVDEERAALECITERDFREEQINRIALALGMSEWDRQWSSANDVGETCIERIGEMLYAHEQKIDAALKREAALREALEEIARLSGTLDVGMIERALDIAVAALAQPEGQITTNRSTGE